MTLVTKFSIAVCVILFPAAYVHLDSFMAHPALAFIGMIVLPFAVLKIAPYPFDIIILLSAFAYHGYSGATNVWGMNKLFAIPIFLFAVILPFLAVFIINKKHDRDIDKITKEIEDNKNHTKNKYFTDGIITSINYQCNIINKENRFTIYKALNEIAFLNNVLDEKDFGMILPEDLKWFANLSTDDIEKLKQTDDLYRIGLLSSELKNGISQEDAAVKTVKA